MARKYVWVRNESILSGGAMSENGKNGERNREMSDTQKCGPAGRGRRRRTTDVVPRRMRHLIRRNAKWYIMHNAVAEFAMVEQKRETKEMDMAVKCQTLTSGEALCLQEEMSRNSDLCLRVSPSSNADDLKTPDAT